MSVYLVVMSLAVYVAAQKYGGDLTHPICSDVGTTSFIRSPSFCGRRYAKFHSPPSAQFMRQNPSLMSDLAMNTLAVGSVSAKA